jgi:DNA helicase II / ATP-dependent DNA helicase PcrA
LGTQIQSAFVEEKQRLGEIAAEINQHLSRIKKIPRYFGDNLTEQVLDERRQINMQNLAIASEEPYFGRLDFKEDGKDSAEAIYIGKVGVSKWNSEEILVIDWRAPVASMFYSHTGGEDQAFYKSPEGIIEGDIHLKRNIVIRKQELQRVVDTYVKGNDDLSGADEFLIYRLGENKDNKLKDIVSTIQAEQNSIIRAELKSPILIQGVAGSGKTTVALHRIAFLLYEYREQMRAERMIIFAPNKMFLDYISNVLPELGVGGIGQTTFLDWVLMILQDNVKVTDMSEKYSMWFSLTSNETLDENNSDGRLKGSLDYRKWLERVMKLFEQEVIPTKNFNAWDGVELSATTVRKWFSEYQHYPLSKRRERVVNRIKKWIQAELDKVFLTHEKKDFKKKANSRLRTYLKQWPEVTPLSFYQLLFQKKKPTFLYDINDEVLPEKLRKHTANNIRKKMVDPEDLAPLILIHTWLYGLPKEFKYQHTVIDEAQDFSPFQLSVLKDFTIGNSFTILGDLSQAIHSYQGIHSWDEFQQVFQNKIGYFELERSYRSTMEIIEFANHVLSNGGKPLMLAKPVFRSGDEVKIRKVSQEEQVAFLNKQIAELQNKGATTIAIIGRTEETCELLYKKLMKSGLKLTFINSKQRDYQGGTSILPVYLSKGLEFDAVILLDVNQLHYQKNIRDSKLLYVACTRALHDLTICYSEDLSLLINK